MEGRKDVTFPLSAQPRCDKTGSVVWEAPVYSHYRKIRRAKGQGASVNGFTDSVRSTGPVHYGSCGESRHSVWGCPTEAETPGTQVGASSLHQPLSSHPSREGESNTRMV